MMSCKSKKSSRKMKWATQQSPSTSRGGEDVSSPSQSSQSQNEISASAEKRKQYLESIPLSMIPERMKRQKTDIKSRMGPKYPELSDSLVLYNPIPKYDASSCPDGFVPVVVHPELCKGKMNVGTNGGEPLTVTQINGLKFMFKCFKEGKGGILAHEMGLGKTRTTITLILTLLEQSVEQRRQSSPGVKKCIIVAPKNAVSVWKDEFAKWRPNKFTVGIVTIYSHMRNAYALIEQFDGNNQQQILIMSYNSFKKYAALMRSFKNPVELVVCDEAHLLKNDATDRSKVIKNFKFFKNNAVWIGLTGTPYQNSLEEYANLISFFRPEALDENYKKEMCRPIMNYYRKHSALNDFMHDLLQELKARTSPAIQYEHNYLDVDKHEMVICCPLNPHPESTDPVVKEYYELQDMLYQEFTASKMAGLCFYNKLDLLTKLCISAVHAYSHKMTDEGPSYNSRPEFTPYREKLDELTKLKVKNSFSSKVAILSLMVLEILQHSPDEKIVVASSSKVLLDMIYDALSDYQKQTEISFDILKYNGTTPEQGRESRDAVIEDFNKKDSARVLLLSCKAGGTALTLTRANHLFLLDPDWNPSNDRQTIGRIYRYGQERTVYIYRLLCTGTIEEIKFLNQLSKEELDKFFKRSPIENFDSDDEEYGEDIKILCPVGDADLLKYFPDTKSHIKDILKKIQEHVDENDIEVQQFAEELQKSEQYEQAEEVPDELLNIQRLWGEEGLKNSISYIFHTKTKTRSKSDEVQSFLFSPDHGDNLNSNTA